jgi:hypothetical protein
VRAAFSKRAKAAPPPHFTFTLKVAGRPDQVSRHRTFLRGSERAALAVGVALLGSGGFNVLCTHNELREINMLWTIVAILFILWLLGFSFGVGGSLVHLVLLVAAVVVVINLLSGRRRLT